MLVTALAAWLSQGTLALAATACHGVALLPVSIRGAVCGRRRRRRVAGVAVRRIARAVVAARCWSCCHGSRVGAGGLADVVGASGARRVAGGRVVDRARFLARPMRRATSRLAAGASRPRCPGGLLACAIYGVAAWQVSPSVPGGDEPHYLIITQSLLKDHDLQIENNHRNGDYRAYFAGDLSKPDYRRRGRNGEIYSIHAPGLPALVAPALRIAGYHGVVVFLILLASAGSALAWHLTWLVTGRCGRRVVRLGGRRPFRPARSFTASRCIRMARAASSR